MISPPFHFSRCRYLRIVLVLVPWLLLPSSLIASDLTELFAKLAERGDTAVAFTEEKTSSFLNLPLIQKGVMQYRAPDTLIREQTSPTSVHISVVSDEVTVKDENSERRLDLNQIPLVKAFLSPLRATLAGDLQALQEHYRVAYSTQDTLWMLRLQPRTEQLQGFVNEVVLSGSGDQIQVIEILEKDGDRSVTNLSPIEPHQ